MAEVVPAWLVVALIPAVMLVAGVYASVGLGGGTGYLAVMTLFGMPAGVITPTALVLNVVVTSAALLRFGLAGRLRWRIFLPFLVPAIPMAFVGGLIRAESRWFFAVLAVALLVASLGMFRSAGEAEERETAPSRPTLLAVGIPAGLVIGLLSGFLGIGGGVFLGPLLLLLGWAGPKQVAAMNSALILILSSVALGAHGVRGSLRLDVVIPLAVAALIGGVVGTSVAEKRLSARTLQRVFAVVVLAAAVKAALDAIP